MQVLVLVGSLRADSFNAQFARAATALLPADAVVTTYAGLGELPFYSEELDIEPAPESVARLRRAIGEADALIVATPEYNGSVSGVLKNAIDWASRPRGASTLAGKPAVVLGASMSPNAALWARQDLVRVLQVAGAKPLETHVGLGAAYDHFADGTLQNEETRASLAGVFEELGLVA